MSTPLWVYLSKIIGAMYETPEGAKYMEACLARKGRGSEWLKGPQEVLSLLLFHSFTAAPPDEYRTPGCAYYRIEGKSLVGQPPTIGTENISIVGEDAREVRIRSGAHGPELYQEVEGLDHHDVDHGWLILGPSDEDPKKMTVWTAYPGRLTRMAKPEDLAMALVVATEGGLVRDLKPFRGCAVKLVKIE